MIKGEAVVEDTRIAGHAKREDRQAFSTLRRLVQRPVGIISLTLILMLVIMAVFAPWISPFDPLESHALDRLQGPSAHYLLGTDQLGRDVLSRTIYGARVSAIVGLLSVTISTVGGSVVAIISGYYGGKLDIVVQRAVDALQAFPGLILALALVSVFGSGIVQEIVAIAVVVAPSDSRVVRGAVLAAKENQYVEAARATGAGDLRIILQHILPNVMAPILILGSIMFGLAILIEGALSFLGLGTPPPTPSWGNMIQGGGLTYLESDPTLTLFPGIAMSLAVLGFNLLGDELRDIWDPRLRGRR
jgi:peptide/nickel transport system permease protein